MLSQSWLRTICVITSLSNNTLSFFERNQTCPTMIDHGASEIFFSSKSNNETRIDLRSFAFNGRVPGDPWCKLNPPEKVARYFLVALFPLAPLLDAIIFIHFPLYIDTSIRPI